MSKQISKTQCHSSRKYGYNCKVIKAVEKSLSFFPYLIRLFSIYTFTEVPFTVIEWLVYSEVTCSNVTP